LTNGLLISKRPKWYLAFAHFHPDDVTDLAVSRQNQSYHLDRHGKLFTKKSQEVIYQIKVTLALPKTVNQVYDQVAANLSA